MAENEINTVHVLIRRFLYEIDDVIKDKDASHKWLVSFAKTLQFQDLCKTPNEYALTLLREAKEFCLSQRKKSQIKQVRKILADEGNASPTKEQIETRWAELYGNDTTADASEGDGEVNPDGQQATQAEAGTSANHSSTTTRTISADEQKRTGGHYPLSQSPSSRSPVRNRHVTGDVLSLAYSGEFGNVRLTQEQYAQLGIKFGNQQKLNRAIDSLSCQIENGEKNPQNHYAELVKWANYRDDMDERKEEEASKPKMTEMEKSWIAAIKHVEAM